MFFKYRDTDRLKVKEWEKMWHANTNHKKAGGTILISDKADFSTCNSTRDKEGCFTIIKGSGHQKEIIIIIMIITISWQITEHQNI